MGQKSFRWWFQKSMYAGCAVHMLTYFYATVHVVPFATTILAVSAFLLAIASLVLAKTNPTLENEENFVKLKLYALGAWGWGIVGLMFLLGIYQVAV